MAHVKDLIPSYPFDDDFVDSIRYAKGRKTQPSMLVIHYTVARSLGTEGQMAVIPASFRSVLLGAYSRLLGF